MCERTHRDDDDEDKQGAIHPEYVKNQAQCTLKQTRQAKP